MLCKKLKGKKIIAMSRMNIIFLESNMFRIQMAKEIYFILNTLAFLLEKGCIFVKINPKV